MKIRLDKLKKAPQHVEFDEPVTLFPELVAAAGQVGVEIVESVSGKLRAVWAGDLIEVSGLLSTVVQVACGRCLEPVRSPCQVEIELSYAPGRGDAEAEETADRELADVDLGLLPVSGEEIDLLPEIEQEIIMALPQRLLCSAECAGLCPVCGANQNRNGCQCVKPVFHSGLAALKDFKVKD